MAECALDEQLEQLQRHYATASRAASRARFEIELLEKRDDIPDTPARARQAAARGSGNPLRTAAHARSKLSKTDWRTSDAPTHDRRLPPRALRRDPGPHFDVQHRQGQRAHSEELVVECADIEAVAQRLLGFGAQRLDPELT